MSVAGFWANFKRVLAYYPLTFYTGVAILIVSAFILRAHYQLGWDFNWYQLKLWASNNLTLILSVFSIILGVVMIASAVAYRKVVDLPEREYYLWLRQRATRTLFPIFTPLHDWLRLRSRLYAWWHAQVFSSITHGFLLVVAVFALFNYFYNSVSVALANGCVDTVEITVNTTWSTNQCHGDVTVRAGATLTINGGITADLGSLTVGTDSLGDEGFIDAKGDTLNGLGVTINITNNLTVGLGSSISANGNGYAGGLAGSEGSGSGSGKGSLSGFGGSAGHGGNGAQASGGGAGGVAYGQIDAPVALGSGGGGGSSGAGGAGGGAIRLTVGQTATVKGTISANGAAGSGGAGVAGGGGSGGSIFLQSSGIDGGGTISSSGGAGANGSPAGAGGRIRLTYTTPSITVTVEAKGGSSSVPGGAGTISTTGGLTIANDSSYSTVTPITPLNNTSYSYSALTVKDRANVQIGSNTVFNGGATALENNAVLTLAGASSKWSGTSLTVQTGTNSINIPYNVTSPPAFTSVTVGSGTLTHDTHQATHLYSLILRSSGDITVTGTINLDGKGFAGGAISTNGNGPGAGTGGLTNGGGGGYGGAGGAGADATPGGGTYGSAVKPSDLGSGGGGGGDEGGSGGGAVELIAGGTLTVSGTISAKGNDSQGVNFNSGGAGSGGGVFLAAPTLAGNGTLTVGGGNGLNGGGCGGGGRLSRHYLSQTFNGTVSVAKGTGSGSCEDGSNQSVSSVDHLLLTGLTTPRTAGQSGSITITARDAANNRNYGYGGTISFTSSDPQATLPSAVQFGASQAGEGTVSGFVLKTAGTQSITAEDDSANKGALTNIVVTHAAFSKFKITNQPSAVTAGNAFSATVSAKDAYNNTVTSFEGLVGFSSTDAKSSMPDAYAFSAGDQGVKTFNGQFTLKSAGSQSISAIEPGAVNELAKDTVNITVAAGSLNSFSFTGQPQTVVAGDEFSFTLSAKDSFGNTVNSYTGTVSFGSSDSRATLPGNYAFTATDGGVRAFKVVLRRRDQAAEIRASEVGSLVTSKATLKVLSAELSQFEIILPASSPRVGQKWQATVRGLDAFGNPAYSLDKPDPTSIISPSPAVLGISGSSVIETFSDQTYSRTTSSYTLDQSTSDATLYIIAHQAGGLVLTASSGTVSSRSAELSILPSLSQAPAAPSLPSQTAQPSPNPFTEAARALAQSLSSDSGKRAGLAVGAATLAANLLVSTPAVSFISVGLLQNIPLFHYLFLVYLPRKRRHRWGQVIDEATAAPVPGVFVNLIDAETTKRVDRIMTDESGQFGFLAPRAGIYKLAIDNPLYEKYESRVIEVKTPLVGPIVSDISVKPNEKNQRRLFRVARLIKFISWLDVIQWPVLIIGTFLAVAAFASTADLLSAFLIGLYLIALSLRLGLIGRRRGWGVVKDSQGQPVASAVVQLTSERTTGPRTFVQSTITDARGRFLLLAKPGSYILTVAKEGFPPKSLKINRAPDDLSIELSS